MGTTHHSQLLQHRLVHAALLEIHARGIDDIVDDRLVHRSNLLVRHLDLRICDMMRAIHDAIDMIVWRKVGWEEKMV